MTSGGMPVQVVCGHRFHLTCLSRHIQEKCRKADSDTVAELRRADANLELQGAARRSALEFGGSLPEMHAAGRIRRCPRCHYGPVLNAQCFDMRSHDADRGSGTGRTTNSCPSCGFFSSSWSDWLVWGAADSMSAARCPLCRGACRIRPEDVPGFQARFQEMDQLVSDCAQLPGRLLALFSALRLAPERPGHATTLEHYSGELDDAPGCSLRLLHGPLRNLLQRRLAAANRVDSSCASGATICMQCHDIIRGAPMTHPDASFDGVVHFGCLPEIQEWRVAPGFRQEGDGFVSDGSLPVSVVEDLNVLGEEIAKTVRNLSPHADEAGAALEQQVGSLVPHRKELAMVLCTVPSEVLPEVLQACGRPWQDDDGHADQPASFDHRAFSGDGTPGELARLLHTVLEMTESICDRLAGLGALQAA